MCSATDSYDIALSMGDNDGAHHVFDGTPFDTDINSNLDFTQTLPLQISGF